MDRISMSDFMSRRADIEKRVLARIPQTPNDHLAKSVAERGDQDVRFLPEIHLPRSLTDWLNIALRDEGNALIEETRQINNRHVGNTIKEMDALLCGDYESIDLAKRVRDWGCRVVKSVLYKARRQVSAEPTNTYRKIYGTAVLDLDTKVAHSAHSIFSLIWTPVMDLIPGQMLEEIFVKTGLVKASCDYKQGGRTVEWSFFLPPSHHDSRLICQHLTFYGYESFVYTRDVVLKRLLASLKGMKGLPSLDVMQHDKDIFVADLLEAFPYLITSVRMEKYMFGIIGADTVAAFDYTANEGFARILLSDSDQRFVREIATARILGALELGFDGTIHIFNQSWKTLESMFGPDDSLRLAYWLLKKSHELVVPSYLKVSAAYMKRRTGQCKDQSDATNTYCSEYTEWILDARNEHLHVFSDDHEPTRGQILPALPQMRRSRLFSLLEHCGVSIEQGKGSEIKLLKDGAHPFRLGSHYGPNPTVPSFLIASILKRLRIKRELWQQAICGFS